MSNKQNLSKKSTLIISFNLLPLLLFCLLLMLQRTFSCFVLFFYYAPPVFSAYVLKELHYLEHRLYSLSDEQKQGLVQDISLKFRLRFFMQFTTQNYHFFNNTKLSFFYNTKLSSILQHKLRFISNTKLSFISTT